MIQEIEAVIARALRMDAATSDQVGVELRFFGLDVEAFDHFREVLEVDEDALVVAKCACGHCGNLVVSLDAIVEHDAGSAIVVLSRSATADETVSYLERIAEG